MKKRFELGNLDSMFMVICIGILGLCIGSFLNVLIDRLSHEEGIGGRSYCDHCKKQLQARDLIPILSFIVNRGKCRYCKKSISFYYPIVEILTSVIFIAIYIVLYGYPELSASGGTGSLLVATSYFIIASSLIVIFFADLKHHIIPDEATFTLFVGSLVLKVSTATSFMFLLPNLYAAIALMGTIFFFFFITRGRGMGFGDVKLVFPMGFLLGLEGGFLALYIAFLIGGFVGLLLLLLRKKGLKSKLPFGPFLVVGTVAILTVGKPITDFFHRLFGLT